MFSEAGSAELQLVNFALNDGNIAAAEFTSAARTAVRHLRLVGLALRLQDAGFQVDSGGTHQAADGEQGGAQGEKVGIGRIGHGGRQTTQS